MQNLSLKWIFIWLNLHTVVSLFMLHLTGPCRRHWLLWSISRLAGWCVILICRCIWCRHFRRYLLSQFSLLWFKRDITARWILSSSILNRRVLTKDLLVSEIRIERWNISDLVTWNVALSKKFLLQSRFRHLSGLRRMEHTHLDSILLCLLAWTWRYSLRLWWLKLNCWLGSILWLYVRSFWNRILRVFLFTAIVATHILRSLCQKLLFWVLGIWSFSLLLRCLANSLALTHHLTAFLSWMKFRSLKFWWQMWCRSPMMHCDTVWCC